MRIELVRDDVADRLDEMADLCEYWKRHRANGRTPTAVRAALMMLAEECVLIARLDRQPAQPPKGEGEG